MFHAMRAPVALASVATGGVTLETMLLQRHLMIDALLEEAIADGRVGQVLEVAAGLSGRGWRFTRKHPSLVYVEGDLPGMVARKQRMLPRRAPNHHLVTSNALATAGPHSIAEAVAPHFSADRGTAIITEGLLSYFRREWVLDMWQRFSALLGVHPHGVYLSDMHLRSIERQKVVATFRRLLALATRGAVALHFDTAGDLEAALHERGFGHVTLHHPRDSTLDLPRSRGDDYVHILEARL